MEIDKELALWNLRTNFSSMKIVSQTTDQLVLGKDSQKLTILIGDAKQTLGQDLPKFHAIFQDAFSSKKNPELWTPEWFSQLASLSHESVDLSTYASSDEIRKAMIAAGWRLREGGPFGRKRSSTRADLKGQTDETILSRLKNSPL